MREIKFRFWDAKYKEMKNEVTLIGLHWACDEDPEVYTTTFGRTYKSEYQTVPHYSDGALMQYTGLKDKNGVEIYEGDVLQSTLTHKQVGKVICENAMFKSIWFKNNPSGGEYDSFLYKVVHHCEVIGNIYENPDLLHQGDKP